MEYFIEKYLQNDWGLIPLIPTKEEVKNSGKTPAGKGFQQNPVKSLEVAQSWWKEKKYNIVKHQRFLCTLPLPVHT